MVWIRSLLFTIALYSITAAMCFLMLWTLALPRRHMLWVVHLWLILVAWCERNLAGMRTQILGREHIPDGCCIIAAKHQSAWETFKLHILFDDPAIVLKKELLRIPLWGWYLRKSGMIPIDRAAGGAALSGMMQAAHKAQAAGRKIVIFPQGTRLAPHQKRPYKSGVAKLYEELAVPVVPMALNSGLYWPKNGFLKKSGTITVEFLPAIPAGLPRAEFMQRLEQELETACERLAHPLNP